MLRSVHACATTGHRTWHPCHTCTPTAEEATTTTHALIVAAGRGTRAGLPGPKQYAVLGGEPVLRRTLRAFTRHPRIDAVSCVVHRDDAPAFEAAKAGLGPVRAITGGGDRQDSVRRGLEALAERDAPDRVLVHDGARPLIGAAVIDRVLDALGAHPGALAALPLTDTLKREAAAGSAGPVSVGTAEREGLWRAQTPQGFRFDAILAVHRAAAHRTGAQGSATDDAGLLEAAGMPVALVAGDPWNIKLTYEEDFVMAEALLAAASPTETRTGQGYDVHAFAGGDAVTLCGVEVAHERGLSGHSDADVGMHALTDALYGALGAGDIGRHFPPTQERWRGAASRVFLEHAAGLLAERGGRVVNADVTLICEAPKITPHAPAMRARLAEALGCAAERVSVKATTTEGLGFEGRREGIAAQAICSVELPR